jgi:general secretion pathway protein K
MLLRKRVGRRSRGFIVVAVLWILAALSALVLVYMSFVTNTAVVVAASSDRVQVDALATAGIELAAYQLTAVREETRPSSGTFNARLGAARVFVTFSSEAARIDLNAAPKELLAGLMAGLGVAPSNAADYADRIVAWRTPAQGGEDDPETASYRTAGIAWGPRHAPFPATEELWLVRGIPPAVIERMLPFVTVFSNMASINIADAAPQVVAALPGMTPERLQALMVQRTDQRTDPRALPGLAGGGAATLEASRAYRVSVTVDFDNGRRSLAEAVILLLDDGDEPYRVLSWRNGADGSTAPQRPALR